LTFTSLARITEKWIGHPRQAAIETNWSAPTMRTEIGGNPVSIAGTRANLRQLVEARQNMLVPGTANALGARIIEDLGYDAVYLTGAGLANTHLGVPDIGLVTVTELADTTARIADVISLPLIVDIDTGFGNAVNTYRTVRLMERSGASALQMEDQVFPKKCGHFNGKGVIPLPEMIGKIKAVVDARTDENLLLIARTDARAVEGFEKAMERAHAFIEAGADLTFVEAPINVEELRAIGKLPVPQLANLVVGGKTPMLSQAELKDMGFAMTLYANAALQATIKAIQNVLGHLKANGSLEGIEDQLAGFIERQRVVDKDAFDALEKRYTGS
jgi:2-methylisocitrate lyase-like PEP mutase family enzyme